MTQTQANLTPAAPLQLMLITYGNGTQIVRVDAETPKGYLVTRFHTSHGTWYAKQSKLKKADPRIHTDQTQESLKRDLLGRLHKAALALNALLADPRYAGHPPQVARWRTDLAETQANIDAVRAAT